MASRLFCGSKTKSDERKCEQWKANKIFGSSVAIGKSLEIGEGYAPMKIDHSFTIDSLGACQRISYQNGKIFLYGDRETGIIKEYKAEGDSLVYQDKEMKLTLK